MYAVVYWGWWPFACKAERYGLRSVAFPLSQFHSMRVSGGPGGGANVACASVIGHMGGAITVRVTSSVTIMLLMVIVSGIVVLYVVITVNAVSIGHGP